MKISKKIKTSKRGLTFSFDGFGEFCPGKKYKYILDKERERRWSENLQKKRKRKSKSPVRP